MLHLEKCFSLWSSSFYNFYLLIGKPVAYMIMAIRHQIRRSQITLKSEMWTNQQQMIYFFIQKIMMSIVSGQITATSAEVTPDGGLIGIFPQNKLNLGIIVNCPDIIKKYRRRKHRFSRCCEKWWHFDLASRWFGDTIQNRVPMLGSEMIPRYDTQGDEGSPPSLAKLMAFWVYFQVGG